MAASSSSANALAPPLTADEVAFLAGETPITIQARAPMPALTLLDGEIPPISALHQERVPLWLAVFLKRRGKCRIIAPDWLDPEALDETLAAERRNQNAFAPLPFHYLEVAFKLLEVAGDDLTDSNRVRATLADIEDTRRSKVERGLRNIDRTVTFIKLTDLSAMELNRIRAVATGALDSLRQLEPGGGSGGGEASGGAASGYGASQGGASAGAAANERLQAAMQKRQRMQQS